MLESEIPLDCFHSHGITLRRTAIAIDDRLNTITVGGVAVQFPDNEYTCVSFTPWGGITPPKAKTTHTPERTSAILAEAFAGLVDLLEDIDAGRLSLPDICVGITNPRMAIMASRAGFEIDDGSKPIIKEFSSQKVITDQPKWAASVVVVASLTDILNITRNYVATGKVPNHTGHYQAINIDKLVARGKAQ